MRWQCAQSVALQAQLRQRDGGSRTLDGIAAASLRVRGRMVYHEAVVAVLSPVISDDRKVGRHSEDDTVEAI